MSTLFLKISKKMYTYPCVYFSQSSLAFFTGMVYDRIRIDKTRKGVLYMLFALRMPVPG